MAHRTMEQDVASLAAAMERRARNGTPEPEDLAEPRTAPRR